MCANSNRLEHDAGMGALKGIEGEVGVGQGTEPGAGGGIDGCIEGR